MRTVLSLSILKKKKRQLKSEIVFKYFNFAKY